MSSLAAQLASLPPDALNDLTDAQAAALLYDWDVWARDKQKEPVGNWRTWLILGGRGMGKTKTGAETVRRRVETARAKRIALVGRTVADVRDVMVEGESGILACSPPWQKPTYEPSKRRLTWPNGAIATTYSADTPDLLRGPQHDFAWCDELAAWPYDDTWDNLMFGLRLGINPQCMVTTTPRPRTLLIALSKASTTHVTIGSTYENRANLAPAFFEEIIKRYEGTRLGRQELLAEILEDIEGALWKRGLIEETRVYAPPELCRVVVAIDPAVTAEETSAETGIVVAGLGTDGHGYVLADYSMRASPNEWGQRAISAYHVHHADRIIGEVNNGGDLIEAVLRGIDKRIPYTAVRATRGKQLRAEPVAALYERGMVHHVACFPELEDQMCGWEPGQTSPDRLDSLVWACTELMVTTELAPVEHVADLKRRLDLMRQRNAAPVQPGGWSIPT